MDAHTHACTHTHTQLFYGSLHFVQDYPGELVPEEAFTHTQLVMVINYPLSASSIYYNSWHHLCSIYVHPS